MTERKKRLVEMKRRPRDLPSQSRCPSAKRQRCIMSMTYCRARVSLPNAKKPPSRCNKPHKQCRAEQWSSSMRKNCLAVGHGRPVPPHKQGRRNRPCRPAWSGSSRFRAGPASGPTAPHRGEKSRTNEADHIWQGCHCRSNTPCDRLPRRRASIPLGEH
jgi:hypothetical protein